MPEGRDSHGGSVECDYNAPIGKKLSNCVPGNYYLVVDCEVSNLIGKCARVGYLSGVGTYCAILGANTSIGPKDGQQFIRLACIPPGHKIVIHT